MAPRRCGVPQCSSRAGAGISLHSLPKKVLNSKEEYRKWLIVLRMGKPFPTNFVICSLHFATEMILTPISPECGKSRSFLAQKAFPVHKLPKSSVDPSCVLSKRPRSAAQSKGSDISSKFGGQTSTSFRANGSVKKQEETASCAALESTPCTFNDSFSGATSCVNVEESVEPSSCYKFAGTVAKVRDIGVQVDRHFFVNFTSLWDTEKKLNTMTGISNFKSFDAMVRCCENARPNDESYMSMKDRVFMTMYKLKSNPTFSELAISFQVSDKTAKLYFADTVQLLSKLSKKAIHWQTKEQTLTSLPACFESFPNVRVILVCKEMTTARFHCLACRTCKYSQYKGTHTLKVLIGVAPSGSVNYVSQVAYGRSSDKANFNLTDLLDKLEPGDAVMVDKGFLIGDELSKAGIEMIRPEFHYQRYSQADVERTTKLAAARVHVERKISRLKSYKMLSEKVHICMIPYMDAILTLLCGLSNLSTPILRDEKFNNKTV